MYTLHHIALVPAQLRSVTDFPPQQPFLCVKRSRILYDSRGGAKAIRYHVNIAEVSKTTTLHVHHCFLYISLLSLYNYHVNWPNFKCTWRRELQGDKFDYLCLNSDTPLPSPPSLSPSLSDIVSLLWRKWTTWKNRERVWKDTNSIFLATFLLASPLSDRKVPIAITLTSSM